MKYSNRFKKQAIRLSDEIGTKLASEQLGLCYETLRDWRKYRELWLEVDDPFVSKKGTIDFTARGSAAFLWICKIFESKDKFYEWFSSGENNAYSITVRYNVDYASICLQFSFQGNEPMANHHASVDDFLSDLIKHKCIECIRKKYGQTCREFLAENTVEETPCEDIRDGMMTLKEAWCKFARAACSAGVWQDGVFLALLDEARYKEIIIARRQSERRQAALNAIKTILKKKREKSAGADES